MIQHLTRQTALEIEYQRDMQQPPHDDSDQSPFMEVGVEGIRPGAHCHAED